MKYFWIAWYATTDLLKALLKRWRGVIIVLLLSWLVFGPAKFDDFYDYSFVIVSVGLALLWFWPKQRMVPEKILVQVIAWWFVGNMYLYYVILSNPMP